MYQFHSPKAGQLVPQSEIMPETSQLVHRLLRRRDKLSSFPFLFAFSFLCNNFALLSEKETKTLSVCMLLDCTLRHDAQKLKCFNWGHKVRHDAFGVWIPSVFQADVFWGTVCEYRELILPGMLEKISCLFYSPPSFCIFEGHDSGHSVTSVEKANCPVKYPHDKVDWRTSWSSFVFFFSFIHSFIHVFSYIFLFWWENKHNHITLALEFTLCRPVGCVTTTGPICRKTEKQMETSPLPHTNKQIRVIWHL